MVKPGRPDRFDSTLDSGSGFAIIVLLVYHQRLSRVAEGTGPLKPQQPGPCAKVLIPAQWGEIRSSVDRNPVVEDSTPKLLLSTAEAFAFASGVARAHFRAAF